MTGGEHSLGVAFESLSAYLGDTLTSRINALEEQFSGACDHNIEDILKSQQLTSQLFNCKCQRKYTVDSKRSFPPDLEGKLSASTLLLNHFVSLRRFSSAASASGTLFTWLTRTH